MCWGSFIWYKLFLKPTLILKFSTWRWISESLALCYSCPFVHRLGNCVVSFSAAPCPPSHGYRNPLFLCVYGRENLVFLPPHSLYLALPHGPFPESAEVWLAWGKAEQTELENRTKRNQIAAFTIQKGVAKTEADSPSRSERTGGVEEKGGPKTIKGDST